MKRLSNLLMFLVVLTGCKHIEDINEKREVFDAKGKQVYTVFANRMDKTMSVVYGNHTAVLAAASGLTGLNKGEQLTIVTYQEEIDPFWYGSNINGRIKSIEQLTLKRPEDGVKGWVYELVEGRRPKSKNGNLTTNFDRIQEILEKRPVVFP